LIAAKAKEKQLSTLTQFAVPQNSAKREQIETRKELSKLAGVSHDTISRIEKIAAKAKENLTLSPGRGKKGSQNSVNLIDTQKELSKLAGVSHDTISRIEKIAAKAKENQGQRTDLTSGRILPNVETRKELSKLAGVSLLEHRTKGGLQVIPEAGSFG